MKEVVTGEDLKGMFTAATAWLEKSAADIDALNVFPVPDGDTGTNMLLTMRSMMEEAYSSPDESVSVVSGAMAHGALMGARGNSGVILSQIMHGLATGLDGKVSFDGGDFARALEEASQAAYKGVSNPVEGTILTVIRDASSAAAAEESGDMISTLESAVAAARDSVSRTPSLLPVLREAGVVDAGGQGLFVILDGALRFLKGELEEMQYRRPQIIISATPIAIGEPHLINHEEGYGYCTGLLIEGREMNVDRIRRSLERKGESVIVVGDENIVRVHIHTFDPGKILSYATSLGTLHEIQIRNMDDQHEEFIASQRTRAPSLNIAIIAVVSGDGLSDVFRSLGATAIVPGGRTMNPSTKEMFQAISAVSPENVILLPNNKNTIPVAEQSRGLTEKRVEVVPTKTIPQGVSALLAFNYEADLETNLKAMERASSAVRTVEVTNAVRSTRVGEFKIKKGQAIGFLDEELVAVGTSREQVLYEVLKSAGLEGLELVTIYHGADTEKGEAEGVAEVLRGGHPQLGVEVVSGRQPNYNYIVSLE